MNGIAARPTAVRWRVLALLVAASFVSYVLRYNVSTAGPAMIEDLSLTEIQFGWILAAFTAGYTVFQFPGGVLGDRFGPRRALAAIAVAWFVLTILTSFVPAGNDSSVFLIVASLIVVRFLVGAAHAPIYPLTNCVIERWFPIGCWALPQGLTSVGLTVGTAVTAPVLAWMLLQYGWRLSFIMLAPLGLAVTALWWWYVRDDPGEHRSVNQAEVELILANRPPLEEAADAAPAWLRVLKNRDVLLLTLSYACMNFTFYEMFNWVFYYLVSIREVASQEAGFLTSFLWIAGAAGALSGGLVCDALTRRFDIGRGCRWTGMTCMLASGLLLLLAALSASVYLTVACLCACFLCNQMTEGAYWAASMGVGGRHAAAAGGVMNTGANAMGFVNSLLVPFIAGMFGWTAAIATGTLFALIGAVLWLFIRADRQMPE